HRTRRSAGGLEVSGASQRDPRLMIGGGQGESASRRRPRPHGTTPAATPGRRLCAALLRSRNSAHVLLRAETLRVSEMGACCSALGFRGSAGRSAPVTLAVRAVFSVMAYLVVVIAPLVFAAIGASRPYHEFWTNFSVALGFVGLAMMGLEFALVARFEAMAAPFGQDALLQFHRQMRYVGLGFVLLHVALSAHWGELWAKLTFSPDVVATPALVMLGSLAVLAMIALVVTSVWRRQLRIPYEWWHAIHTVLAVVAVVGALVHV